MVPDLDEQLFKANNETGLSYFSDALLQEDPKKVDEIISKLDLNHEDGDIGDPDSELPTFERKGRKMINLIEDGGVKKKELRSGLLSEDIVPNMASVTLHYSLFLEDQDEPFDSSITRGRSERFKLDDGQLIPGLEIAIKTMRMHEKSEFLIEPRYAYGEMGCPPRIPGNAQIMAIIELLDYVQEGEAECLLRMTSAQRNKEYGYDQVEKAVRREHIDGNHLTKKEEWKLAARRYKRGCELLEEVELKNEEEEKRQQHLLLKLYANSALCYIKIGWPKKACLVLQSALEIDGKDPKILYRMGKAKSMLANYEDALKYLTRATKIDPDNAVIGDELARVDRLLKNERLNEKAMYRKMLGDNSEKSKCPSNL